MTLAEFIERKKQDIANFEENWKTNNSRSADDYPSELGEADREEQFIMFCGLNE